MEDNFFERVYEIVRQIPEGKVTSYELVVCDQIVSYLQDSHKDQGLDADSHRITSVVKN